MSDVPPPLTPTGTAPVAPPALPRRASDKSTKAVADAPPDDLAAELEDEPLRAVPCCRCLRLLAGWKPAGATSLPPPCAETKSKSFPSLPFL